MASSSALAYVELTDKLACQASRAVYGVLRASQLVRAADVQAVEDQESFSIAIPTLDETGGISDFIASLRAGRILTAVYEDGSFDEWRISTITRGRGEGGLVSVLANSLWYDLVERADTAGGMGWVSEVSAGQRTFEYELTQRTPTSILSTYVIPNLPSYITLGTVDPTVVLRTLTVSRMTPGALVIAVRDACRALDVACEVQLRRNGTTDYKLDLVTEIGSGGNTPVFHPANSLLTLQEKADAMTQATRILITGSTNPDGDAGQWGVARFRGGVPVGNTIPLTDRNGGTTPIAFDNQFVGGWLYRCKTGRTFPITSSSAATGSVTCAGGISTIAVDEDFEFRYTEPLTNTLRLGAQDGFHHVRPYVITGVAGTVLTLTDNFGATVADPVQVNDEHVDWYARRMTLVRATTANGNFSGGVLTNVLSTVGVVAGDVLFLSLTGVPPYGFALNNGALVVDSTTVNTITVHARDDAALGTFAATPVSIRIYRPVTTLHRITTSAAAGNTITVDAAGTAANTDVIEFVQVDGAGEIPCTVDHPTYVQADPIGYGVKVMELTRQALGIVQHVPNGWQRSWAVPANPPDGWSVSGGATTSQNTSATFTRCGGLSYKWVSGAGAASGLITTPVFYPSWSPGATRYSVRAFVYFETFAVGAGANFQTKLTIYAATAAGAVGTSLGSVSVQPTDAGGTFTKVGTGTWIELKIGDITLANGTAPYGLIAELSTGSNANAGASTGYLDAIEFYPFSDCPNDACEFGDAPSLLQAGNNTLRDVASTPLFYRFEVSDLARAFGTEYSRLALTLGADVRAADVENGMDTTVRLLRMDRDLLDSTKTTLTLANRPTRFSAIAAANARQQRRVVTVIQQGQASVAVPYVPLTGTTTLTTNAEIVTAQSGAPIVVLPTDSAVTYVPASTTSPKTSVTSGLPPSRLPSLPLISL